MSNIKIGIHRVWGNELTPPVINDDEVAVSLHNNRKEALHDIFDREPYFKVVNWGYTDAKEPREYVELIVNIIENAPALEQLGHVTTLLVDKLIDTGLDKALGGVVTWLVLKFKKKQDTKKVSWVKFHLAKNIVIEMTNPQEEQKIKIYKNNKLVGEVEFTPA